MAHDDYEIGVMPQIDVQMKLYEAWSTGFAYNQMSAEDRPPAAFATGHQKLEAGTRKGSMEIH